jgi:hypothetical protein
MPSPADQLSAVLNAPIPFLIALVFLAWGMWRTFEWRYRAVIDKMKEMAVLSRAEVDHWKDALARSTSQTREQVEVLQKKKLPAELKPVVNQLSQSVSRSTVELVELGKANTFPVSEVFRRSYAVLDDLRPSAATLPSGGQPSKPVKASSTSQ